MANVLITGANRGIGLELSKRYAEAGHRVFACCRAPDAATALNALAAAHDDLSVHGVHVSDGASVAALAAALGDTPIDILINNAGMNPPMETQTLTHMDFDAWAETMAVNTMAPLRVLQALLPNLQASTASPAKAVTITSMMGALSLDWAVAYAYCSSKAAVNKVMRMASLELKKDGIAVSLLHPGHVQTDMGGPNGAITVDVSAAGMMAVIDDLTLDNSGEFKVYDGSDHAW